MKKLAYLALGLVAIRVASAQTQINIDLEPSNTTTPTSGYVSYIGAPINQTSDPAAQAVGSGVTLDFSTVGTWSNSTPAQPLTGDGFFVNAGTSPASFVLSGLAPGSTVTLYGIQGWNTGSGGFVSFGTGTLVDLNLSNGSPGTTPTLADFTLVGSATVPAGGTLSGSLFNSNGVITRGEGQIGGLIIQISAVPEPSSIALLFCGGIVGAGALWLRRRTA